MGVSLSGELDEKDDCLTTLCADLLVEGVSREISTSLLIQS